MKGRPGHYNAGMTSRTRLLHALTGQPVDRLAVWFMRQAGRHLPEYRELRQKASFLELCRDPVLNAEASCQPWRRYGVDAVIVFNDILIPLADMGLELDFTPGPVLQTTIQTRTDVERLATPNYEQSPPSVAACLVEIKRQIKDDAGLLGFVGAPFTVAGYALTCSTLKQRATLPEVLPDAGRTAVFSALRERLLGVLVDYAVVQVRAGADAIQVFESSAGEVEEATYRRLGLPSYLELLTRLRSRLPDTPLIAFGRGIWPFVTELARAGATAVSVDAAFPLCHAREILKKVGLHTALQGNLDPSCLCEEAKIAARAAEELLQNWRAILPQPQQIQTLGPTGWVFNLGHGVPADATPDTVQAVVNAVQRFVFR